MAGSAERAGEHVDDLLRRVAVAVRVRRAGHRLVGLLVAEQRRRPALDRSAVGADEDGVPGLDALGSLGRPADDDHRLAERRHLLLEPSGVGDHEVAAPQEPDHRLVVERVEQADVGIAAEQVVHGLAHLRVPVDGDDDLHLGVAFGDGAEARAHVLERLRAHLAAVHRRDDQALPVQPEVRERRRVGLERHAGNGLERVDDGVAGHVDTVLGDALAVEVLRAGRGRREMDVGEHAGDAAVHLLRPGIVLVERAQARLDVADLPALLEGGEARGHRRRRVALDEHPVGPLLLEDGAQAVDHGDRHVVQRLRVLHHVQVVVRLDLEQVEHLVEHLAVLAGDADPRDELVGAPLELLDHRSELDRLRARAEDRQDLDHVPGFRRFPSEDRCKTHALRPRF